MRAFPSRLGKRRPSRAAVSPRETVRIERPQHIVAWGTYAAALSPARRQKIEVQLARDGFANIGDATIFLLKDDKS